jgi:hypothetical protein
MTRDAHVLSIVFLAACAVADGNLEERAAPVLALLESPGSAADCPEGTNVIEGTEGADLLVGTGGPDCILGHGGDDTLRGMQGADILVGGAGADIVEGGPGDDQLFGGADGDVLAGGPGDDALSGGDGADALFGQQGLDVLLGGAGDDILDGAAGDDQLFGDGGDDHLIGGNGGDTIAGGDGEDLLEGGAGDDLLEGGAGDDRLGGGAGNDTLIGAEGDDALAGDGGDDLLLAGEGHDSLSGGGGEDALLGGEGNDVLDGGDGVDSLQGGGGDDLVAGDANDSVAGGDGNDTCAGTGCEDGAVPITDCLDDAGCPGGSRCESNSGVCVACLGASACDDGLFCNGSETCVPASGCQAGEPVACDDGDPCTSDACDEDAGECVSQTTCLQATEVQLTSTQHLSSAGRISADATGLYVVYGIQPPGQLSRIELLRIAADGQPDGSPVILSDGLTHDVGVEASGDIVVWIARPDPGELVTGAVVVHDLATGEQVRFDEGSTVDGPKTNGELIVWAGRDELDRKVIRGYSSSWGTLQAATLVLAPFVATPGNHVPGLAIGSRFLVWEAPLLNRPVNQRWISGMDLVLGGIEQFGGFDGTSFRSAPSTHGNRLAFTALDPESLIRVEVIEHDPEQPGSDWQPVHIGPPQSRAPSLGSELLAYNIDGGSPSSDLDLEVVDLATGAKLVIGQRGSHEIAASIHGRWVLYHANRGLDATYDVFLARVTAP